MAFFGWTYLGYQNPIGDRMILNPRGPSYPNAGNSNIQAGIPPSLQEQPGPLRCIEDCQVSHQPLPYSTDIHHGSHERYKGMVRRLRTPRSGNSNIQAGIPPSLQEQPGPLRCIEDCQVSHQPLPYSTDIHHGSHERYKGMVRRLRTPRSPNQLYVMPLTENQQYGWMASKKPEPWTQVRRFPRKNSEMTKFVKEMLKADPDFSLI